MSKSRVTISSKIIAEALKASGGKVYIAATALHCDPQTIYRRMDREPKLRAICDDARGRMCDIAEIALERAIVNGDAWAVCFTLKCLGKDRGYVETVRNEITGAGGGPLEIQAYRYEDAVARIAARPDGDSIAPGEDQSGLRRETVWEDHDGG